MYRTGTGWTSLEPRVHRHGAHGGGIAAHGDGAVVLAKSGPAHVAFVVLLGTHVGLTPGLDVDVGDAEGLADL